MTKQTTSEVHPIFRPSGRGVVHDKMSVALRRAGGALVSNEARRSRQHAARFGTDKYRNASSEAPPSGAFKLRNSRPHPTGSGGAFGTYVCIWRLAFARKQNPITCLHTKIVMCKTNHHNTWCRTFIFHLSRLSDLEFRQNSTRLMTQPQTEL